MRKGWIVGAVVALLVAAGVWYYASPAWTLRSMASAAQDGDADKLGSYIDFPKVRESAKSQIKAQAVQEMQGAQGFEALGMMMAMSMADPMIDAMISPEALRVAFARRADDGAEPVKTAPAMAGAMTDKPFGVDTANSEVVRDGLDHFRLRGKSGGDKAGELVFERRGLGWVLADIRLPTDLMKGAPGATRK